jgi:hypothetical protein
VGTKNLDESKKKKIYYVTIKKGLKKMSDLNLDQELKKDLSHLAMNVSELNSSSKLLNKVAIMTLFIGFLSVILSLYFCIYKFRSQNIVSIQTVGNKTLIEVKNAASIETNPSNKPHSTLIEVTHVQKEK